MGRQLTTVELQSEGYANAKLKWFSRAEPLPFLYESTGQVTRFTNGRDPNPRSREIFTFHRPETFKDWMLAPRSLRAGIAALPPLDPSGLRDCQTDAIINLEASLKADKPRALVQMAAASATPSQRDTMPDFATAVLTKIPPTMPIEESGRSGSRGRSRATVSRSAPSAGGGRG